MPTGSGDVDSFAVPRDGDLWPGPVNSVGTEPRVIEPAVSIDEVYLRSDGSADVLGRVGLNALPGEFGFVPPAVPGTLDPSFGDDGIVVTHVGPASKSADGFSVSVQRDGKILVGGSGEPSAAKLHVTVLRYLPDGTLDPDFGDAGIASVDADGAIARRLTVDDVGRIVAASANANMDSFVAARFSSVGSLDSSFGTGGWVRFAIGSDATIAAIATRPNAKIIMVGDELPGLFTLAQVTETGVLDAEFGTGGIVTTSFSGTDVGAEGMVLQPDGRVVVAGVGVGGTNSVALARYLGNGDLDMTFGIGGTTLIPRTFDLSSMGFLRLSDGRYMVATADSIEDDIVLLRINADGTLDPTFGTGGEARFRSSEPAVSAMTRQADDRIIIAVQIAAPAGGFEFALYRFHPDGSIDTSFNPNGPIPGVLTFGIGDVSAPAEIVVAQDGRLVVTGFGRDDSGIESFATARVFADTIASVVVSAGGRHAVTATVIADGTWWVWLPKVGPGDLISATATTDAGQSSVAFYQLPSATDRPPTVAGLPFTGSSRSTALFAALAGLLAAMAGLMLVKLGREHAHTREIRLPDVLPTADSHGRPPEPLALSGAERSEPRSDPPISAHRPRKSP